MVAAADIVARSIALPRELPVGIITALIGGPVVFMATSRSAVASRSGNP